MWKYHPKSLNHLCLSPSLTPLWLQEALEEHDGASKGKYTIGLGQDCLGFCTELEDVISMRLINALSVTFLLSRTFEDMINAFQE